MNGIHATYFRSALQILCVQVVTCLKEREIRGSQYYNDLWVSTVMK